MAVKANYKDFSINTIIGQGSNVHGDIEATGFTRVDGNVNGDLNVHGRVVIGEDARLKSCVSGTFVTIGGVVHGNVVASERLVVLSTGLVLGDVITRRIQADEGCLIHGKVVVCKDEEKWEAVVAEYNDAQAVRQVLEKGGASGKQESNFFLRGKRRF
ncbi:MAG: polymer-forming cytoskeletal protein [Spirochaetaceae bacterium]|jgi:cytoskeletal protein CcmA (bactofilin family)|nr:polymer-forming cytoskeletal protein [Spirochaetaceae bacterium]